MRAAGQTLLSDRPPSTNQSCSDTIVYEVYFAFASLLLWPTRKHMKRTDKTVPADLKLSDFLCFAVYSTNLAFGKAYKPILEHLGLTYTQYITIVALWEEDHQTVGSLGEKLFLE